MSARFLSALLLTGCVLAPDGFEVEAERATVAGTPWQAPPDQRVLPPLDDPPTREQVVARALLADGTVEAAAHDWAAAVERVRVEAGWPTTNVAIGITSPLTNDGDLFDRTLLEVGFDPMELLQLPTKTLRRGEVALAAAYATGHRFQAARLATRRAALLAWLDLALWAERVALREERVALLALASGSAGARVRVGGAQQELLALAVEQDLARAGLEAVRAEEPALRAALNALLARRADAPLVPPALPPARPRPASAELLAAGVARNPELAALLAESGGRAAAIDVAELGLWPDVAPSYAEGEGSEDSTLTLDISVPVTIPSLLAAIEAAEAELRAAEARRAQAGRDTSTDFVATLAALEADERRVGILEGSVLGAAQQISATARVQYVHATAAVRELVDAGTVALDAREVLAESRVARERRLVELETLGNFEVEALGGEP